MAALAVGGPLAAQAGVIGTAIDNGNGTFTYEYTVDNVAGTFDVMGWSLAFDFGSTSRDWDPVDVGFGGDVVVPSDWIAGESVPAPGLVAQDFFSLFPGSDVATGGSLGGFSFVSALPPGPVRVESFGPSGDFLSEFTIGPVIPEPAGAATLALALGGVYAIRRRGRQTTSTSDSP